MKKQLFALICAVAMLLSLAACGKGEPEADALTFYAMDTVMRLTATGENRKTAMEEAEAALRRLDLEALSRTSSESELSALNKSGALGGGETADLIDAALTVSEATHGAFDPTLAPVLDAWGFTGEAHRVPTEDELAALLARTGADKVTLTRGADGKIERVTLADGAQLDLGGIAKGYAGDVVRSIFEQNGISSAMIDLGGDVCAMGAKPNGSNWRIAVKDPADTGRFLGVLELHDSFVVTSGVYERYFEENGVRYHHIVDPATGYPAESGLTSVTVVCENGAWADALSTAAFVLGTDGALALRETLADKLSALEYIFVTTDGRVLYTDGLADHFTPSEEGSYTYEAIVS